MARDGHTAPWRRLDGSASHLSPPYASCPLDPSLLVPVGVAEGWPVGEGVGGWPPPGVQPRSRAVSTVQPHFRRFMGLVRLKLCPKASFSRPLLTMDIV
jgi:hypothetical protein